MLLPHDRTDPRSPTHKLDPWATARGIIYPTHVAHFGLHVSLASCHSLYTAEAMHAPACVKQSAVLIAVKVFPVVAALLALLVWSGVDVKFYMLDLVCSFIFYVAMVVTHHKNKVRVANRALALQQHEHGSGAHGSTRKAEKTALPVYVLIEPIVIGTVAIAYPIYVVPAFLAAGHTMKLVFLLVIQPLVFELVAVVQRTFHVAKVAKVDAEEFDDVKKTDRAIVKSHLRFFNMQPV